MKTPNSPKISEANVSKAIRDLLAAKRIQCFRMNSSKQLLTYTNKAGQTKKRMLLGHTAGTADLLAMPKFQCGVYSYEVRPLWIEVKSPGKPQSDAQRTFQKEQENYGCSYLLADSIDTVISWLKDRGL